MKEIEIHFKGGDGKRIKTLPEVPDNNDYVDLLTPQDIDGKKNFTQTPTINGKDIATQEKLDEVSNSKQNTLTAGDGISIENDTISVTDAGGLTVLPYGNLDADTTAKVFANPQNYCIGNDTGINGYVVCYYGNKFDTNTLYYSSAYDLVEHTRIRYWYARIDKKSDGTATMVWGFSTKLQIDNATINSNSASYPLLQCKGVLDFVDNSVKTGTQIRKAITIRKWH